MGETNQFMAIYLDDLTFFQNNMHNTINTSIKKSYVLSNHTIYHGFCLNRSRDKTVSRNVAEVKSCRYVWRSL